MLQAIRDKAQGWVAWAIVILISIPFALWGIQEYLGVGGEPEAAVVDGEKITQRMLDQRTREFRENLRQSLGDRYTPGLVDDELIKTRVLDAMIDELVLGRTAQDWNLRTGDSQARNFIATNPAFQLDGRFDQRAYEAGVRSRGMSKAGYEQVVRQALAMNQLRAGISNSAIVTNTGLATRIRLKDQKRLLHYARIPAQAYLAEIETTPEAVQRFYESNIDRYRTPERIKLGYLLLDAASLGDLVRLDEQALRDYFAEHRGDFVAREERAMRHILFSVAPDADEQTVQDVHAAAAVVLEELRAGADFAELAKQHSADPGSSGDGGDLGWVERGTMVGPFEEAAFALNQGEVSDLVRTDFGLHIIQVTAVRGGSDAGFDELRNEVEQAYRRFEGENLYFDYAERLAETAYENADSLGPAAEALGLNVQSTDWVTRDSALAEPLASPKVLDTAFSDDVLLERNNSELIEIGQQRVVVVRVADHEPAGVKSLEENSAAVETDFRQHQASEVAAKVGERMLKELRTGERALKDVASAHAWRLEKAGLVGREQPSVPADVLAAAFQIPPPPDATSGFAGIAAADGDYLLIEVSEVQGGTLDSLSSAERPLIAEQATERRGNAELGYVSRDLRARADVEIKPIKD